MSIYFKKGIYAITDCVNCSDIEVLEKSEIILKQGISLLQYRNKTDDYEKNLKLATELKLLCSQFCTPFIINDDIILAKKIAADGVHLGAKDHTISAARDYLGECIIGASCYNSMALAIKAEQEKADYVALGSFYYSYTKPKAINVNIELLKQVKSKIKLPVVAIGGVTPENGGKLITMGADILAIVSGLYLAKNTILTTKNYIELF